MKKGTHPSASRCEYLVGDDSCGTLKESDLGALRAESCHNEVKDACCYLCSLRESCDISCDLPIRKGRRKAKNDQQLDDRTALKTYSEMECGRCIHYLKPKCPRGYDLDTELWRRQDPCEDFKPSKKTGKIS